MPAYIHYRDSLMDEEELAAIPNRFEKESILSAIPPYSYIIPRYTVLPFVKDYYAELEFQNHTCINTLDQHFIMADMKLWSKLIPGLTPEVWDETHLATLPQKGPYVLKGQTNSMKQNWDTHMFAKTKSDAIRVYGNLAQDNLIGSQKIYIRPFVQLKKLMDGINGLPVSKEFRLFCYGTRVLSSGFYWQNYTYDLPEIPKLDVCPVFLSEVLTRLGEVLSFYVIDIGQLETGEWTVIEVNDGCMSGLSCCDPVQLYTNLDKVI